MYFLRTYDTIYDEGQQPLECDLLSKFEQEGRHYWLLKTSRPFPHFAANHFGVSPVVDHKGRHGERVPSDFVLVMPRHAGFSFDAMPSDGLHVHLCVPKSDCYPPDSRALNLADYVHLYWGLLYSTLADAQKSGA